MCILFIYNGTDDPSSDYRLIVASNRDEVYHRPAQNLAQWSEDPNIIGGKDLEGGGTWLAISPARKKIAALLNMPSSVKVSNAKSRGQLVTEFVSNSTQAKEYIAHVSDTSNDYNTFILITVELGSNTTLQSYSNVNNSTAEWKEPYVGFSNSLPETPLKKVVGGTEKFKDICRRSSRIGDKSKLIDELLTLLKDKERYYPDPLISQNKRPEEFNKALSSIFVDVPTVGYGTRTHTLILITKSGHMDVVEITMKPDDDAAKTIWERTELQFDLE